MFKRLDLGAKETPLQFSETFSDFLGVPFYTKREDLCGANTSLFSSEARKLEFLIPDLASSKTEVVAIGNYKQPFMKVLAQAVGSTGIPVHLVYLDDLIPELFLNLSTAQLCGAKTHGTQSLDYVANLINSIEQRDKTAYILRPGGSGSVASMGGYALMDELHLDLLSKFGVTDATIYVLSDSGTTQAGMLSSLQQLNAPGLCIKGVSLVEDHDLQYSRVGENQANLLNLFEALDVDTEEFSFKTQITPDFSRPRIPVGVMSDISLSLAQRFYLDTGMILDHLFALPVLSALVDDVQQGRVTGPVVFINPVRDTVPFFNYNT